VALLYCYTPRFPTSVGVGKWLVRDPLLNVERLQGLNLYWYVGNNPNNWVDSNGQIPIAPILGGVLGGEIIDPIGGGIIGGYLAWQAWNLMINSQPDNYTPSNRDRNQDKCDKMGGEDNDPNKGKGPKKGTPDYDKWRREHEKRKKETGRGGADNPPEKSEWF